MRMAKTQEEVLSEIDGMAEIHLYFLIDFVGAVAWRMNHDASHGRILKEDMEKIDKDIERWKVQQDRAVRNLTRFGVHPLDDGGKPTAEYWAWYKWWSNWHKDELSNKQWLELDRKMSAKEDVSTYRPTGDWRTLVKPAS